MEKLKYHFGKLKINKNKKTPMVQEVFSKISQKYDLMNDLMSLGFHRLWKKELIEIMNIENNENIIDIGAGTGDLAFQIYKKNPNAFVTSVDLNLDMLKVGLEKKKKNKCNNIFINANAENLPFKNNSFDKYVISFCLRNITFMETALDEALRVLKPNGIFYCLEFSSPKLKSLSKFYDFYKSKIIPKIGKYIAKNEDAYNYLDQSISMFPNQELLKAILIKKGFNNVSNINFFNGIVSLHIGYKTI
ncbi:MAG: Ubiquinone/menaquinone biosynthesis C-methyltransferase UbiE [Alphaproteobacteria bacterium MarineAlpha5_Bin9]|nr:MAG: Ubiquinone/menaquinone biosynthesis C-methyltransferase UbiE [Alphaproteobacteria bacterium MarineAlpha5_Bin9]|tara:strand:- start:19612 stop:20352 length:741 start_codon:yes stop_codon:yes gene_type:complete